MTRSGLVLSVSAALFACRSPAERLAKAPELELPGQGKCTVGGTASHPLVVEWAAAERASLEARLQRGLVAVRAEGCEIEVLRQCDVRGEYSYLGLTRKNDRVKIRTADELYAQMPLGAARLEAKLARAGQLDVEIALVGMFEAPEGQPGREALAGDCEAATHIITGVQVGAFQFLAGGTGEIKAGGGMGQFGAGVGSTAERETLSADGEPARCDAATSADTRPPEGCGALIRVELTALPAAGAAGPAGAVAQARTCPVGSRWDGYGCALEPCPVGMSRKSDGTCVAAPAGAAGPVTTPVSAPTTTAATTPDVTPASAPAQPASDEAALCQKACERDLTCKAETAGVAGPEGQGRERLLRMCRRTCEFMLTDFNRAQMRKCVGAASCAEFSDCVGPPDAL